MTRLARWMAALAVCLGPGCTSIEFTVVDPDVGSQIDTRRDTGRDAGAMDASRDAMTDSRAGDTGLDARPDASADSSPPVDVGPTGLHPDLAVARGDGGTCAWPGGLCPGIAMCRFYSATENRCERCGPCGNLANPCVHSSDCDILFMCFQGECTNVCQLDLGCGGVIAACIDVGHPTHGVCRPRF